MKPNLTRCPQAPFKCVGGKTRLLPAIRTLIPEAGWTAYSEPFVGAGALYRFLVGAGRLDDKEVVLSDWSPGTIRAWWDVKNNARWTEDKLNEYEARYNTATEEGRRQLYLSERATWNTGALTGARHIFLRQTAFNGLWRESKKGKFNVPWGRYKRFNAPNIMPLHEAVRRIHVELEDFSAALARAREGWLVYCDPPYLNEFDKYTADGFGPGEHVRLLRACREASDRGAFVIYSNRLNSTVTDLRREYWPDAIEHRTLAQQTVAAKSAARGAVEELLVTSR